MQTAKQMTLGSLFDGIGGFPLAGKYAGLRPVWASEIEPFPIRVTEKRLPEMKHYGDIRALHGAKLEPVDVIAFGSPCQDVSAAGRREGISGERSGLFFEAIRIIREMRDATHGEYPGWAVWENVPGAMSSNHGEDFRRVVESLIRVKAPEADVPLPAGGRWLPAGEIMGDGYSLAWRMLDAAQGWGVAQRRKRVFAVLDLAGQRAGQVLFESEGVSGYTPPRGEAGQGAAAGTAGGAGAAGRAGRSAGGFCTGQSSASRSDGYGEECAPTLRGGKPPGVAIGFNPTDGRIRINRDGLCQTLCSRMGTGGNQTPLTLKIRSRCEALMAWDYKAPAAVSMPAYALDRACFSAGENAQYRMNVSEEVAPTLVAEGPAAIADGGGMYIVRRLTPLECCRLQGFPDDWAENLGTEEPREQEIAKWIEVFEDWYRANGKHSKPSRNWIARWLKDPRTDAAGYKAYGNSVAVPCVFFVLAGIVWAEEQEGCDCEKST